MEKTKKWDEELEETPQERQISFCCTLFTVALIAMTLFFAISLTIAMIDGLLEPYGCSALGILSEFLEDLKKLR